MLSSIKRLFSAHNNSDASDQKLQIHPTDVLHLREATVDDIFYCFRLILGRSPHKEEWTGHSSRAGENLEDVVKTYLNSREFHDRQLMTPQALENVVSKHNGLFTIFANPDDGIIGAPSLAGEYEPLVHARIREILKPGDSFLDVGANIGYFSLAAAQVVGSTGHVLAVEPNAENVRLLLQSIAANHFQNIEVAQVAVSSKIETILLHATVGNGTTSKIGAGDNIGDAKLVPAIPIDNLVSNRKQRINLIKIDVEGFEPIALSGAETVIKKDKPKLIFEFSATDLVGTTPQAFLQMLDDWGYQFTPVLEGADRNKTVTPSELIEIFEKHNSSHIDVLAEQA